MKEISTHYHCLLLIQRNLLDPEQGFKLKIYNVAKGILCDVPKLFELGYTTELEFPLGD